MQEGVPTGEFGQSLSADIICVRIGDEGLSFDNDEDDKGSLPHMEPSAVEKTRDSNMLRQVALMDAQMKERTRVFDETDGSSTSKQSQQNNGAKKNVVVKTNSGLFCSLRSDGSMYRTRTTRSGPSVDNSMATAHDVTIDPNHGLCHLNSEDLFMSAEVGSSRFKYVRLLGEGGFGIVNLHMDLEDKNKLYAVKTVPKICRRTRRTNLKELAIGKVLDHPSIIKLYHVIEDDDTFKLVMELCTGGDLGTLISTSTALGLKSPFKRKVHLFHVVFQMLSGLAYLHHYGMCHRDIKPENYMLSRNLSVFCPPAVKLIDFGLARATDENNEVMYSQVGSWRFAAPEVLECLPYRNSCDVWGLGCTLYTLIVMTFPYPGETAHTMLKNIHSGDHSPQWEHPHFMAVGPSVTIIIRSLLEPSPGKRPRCADILACNPWLHDYAVNSTQSRRCCCMP